MKKKLLNIVNQLLSPLGVEMVKKVQKSTIAYQQLHNPSTSYMKDAALKQRLNKELAYVADAFFKDHLSCMDSKGVDFQEEVESFFSLYCVRPFGSNKGGSGFHNSFWIYMLLRILRPTMIVESGIWKGHTSWLFQNTCPDAKVYGFDVNLKNLECNDERIEFIECDWKKYDLGAIDADKSLVFFDCHVNHAKRILESHQKGIRHLLFDDNPPLHKLYAYGLPGFPTAEMVYRGEDRLTEITWIWQGEEKVYSASVNESVKARELIESYYVFPDVGDITKYGGYSFLTYIKLRG